MNRRDENVREGRIQRSGRNKSMESLERPLKEAVEADIGPSGFTILQIGESRP
jgi:hypothetical protein